MCSCSDRWIYRFYFVISLPRPTYINSETILRVFSYISPISFHCRPLIKSRLYLDFLSLLLTLEPMFSLSLLINPLLNVSVLLVFHTIMRYLYLELKNKHNRTLKRYEAISTAQNIRRSNDDRLHQLVPMGASWWLPHRFSFLGQWSLIGSVRLRWVRGSSEWWFFFQLSG